MDTSVLHTASIKICAVLIMFKNIYFFELHNSDFRMCSATDIHLSSNFQGCLDIGLASSTFFFFIVIMMKLLFSPFAGRTLLV
jgi:hypothetical protein